MSSMTRARRAAAQAEPERQPDDAGVFRREFGIALDRVDEIPDEDARAATLARFLEGGHRQTWDAVRASWRASADRRQMVDMSRTLRVGWWWQSEHDFELIEYSGDLHQRIVAGTGGGATRQSS